MLLGRRSVYVHKSAPNLPKHKLRLSHSRMARATMMQSFCAYCWETILTASITGLSGNTSRLDLLHRRRRSRGGGLAVVISLLAFPRRLVGGPAPTVQNLIALWLPRLSISRLIASIHVLICCCVFVVYSWWWCAKRPSTRWHRRPLRTPFSGAVGVRPKTSPICWSQASRHSRSASERPLRAT